MSYAATYEGIPQIIGGFSTDSDGATAIIRPAEKALNIGAVLNGMLRQIGAPAVVVIDSAAGAIFGTDASGVVTALQSALANPLASVDLVPDAGQVGRSVTWHTANLNNWSGLGSVTDPAVTAVKPSKTVETIALDSVKRMLQFWGEPLFLVIDQTAGTVKLLRFGVSDVAGVSAALQAVNGGGQSIGILLKEKTHPNFV